MEWYLGVFKKYVDFSGRARPKEYWMFALINVFVAVALLIFDMMIIGRPVLYFLYILAIIVPAIALQIRRLHDTNRSGWWLLLSFVPFGGIVLLFFYIMGGTIGPNKYGPDPVRPELSTITAPF